MNHEHYMEIALHEAENALKKGEFPVGCVIAGDNGVLAKGARTGTSEEKVNEIEHAEIIALKNLSDLEPPVDSSGLTIFSTMEPCLMCFGAILLNGISKIVYAFEDIMGGGTGCDVTKLSPLYTEHNISITRGVLREKSLGLFHTFFSSPDNSYWKKSLLSEYTLGLKK